MGDTNIVPTEYYNCPYCHRIIPDYAICNCVKIYNQALEDFKMALEKHQMENWIDNLEYGITFDDVEEVINQLKK